MSVVPEALSVVTRVTLAPAASPNYAFPLHDAPPIVWPSTLDRNVTTEPVSVVVVNSVTAPSYVCAQLGLTELVWVLVVPETSSVERPVTVSADGSTNTAFP